jgi:outer membrane lipoprotein LolB
VIRRVAWLLLGVSLSGCVTAPSSVVVAPPGSGDPVPETWMANGRLAINVSGQGGSAAFVWRQNLERSDVAVRGPLGVGVIDVTVDGTGLTVTDGAGVTLSGDAAQAQVRARLGADLPLSSLRYWVLARPDPATTAEVLDSPQSPVRVIEQNGWRVAYDEFGRFGGQSAPVRLSATSDDVRLKFVVDRWDFGAAASPGSP